MLAAGAGRRFGGTKQLADLDGRPLLQHAVDNATSAEGLDRVVIVLGHDAERVRAALELGRAEVVVADDWEEGQAASLRAGVAAAGDAEAVVVFLGDQPRLAPDAIARVLAARGDHAAVRATHEGAPGHPVVLERELLGDVMRLRGDMGARELLERHRVEAVEMGPRAPDVDTPEQLEEVRR